MSNADETRIRPHPHERFAGAEHRFDLAAVSDQLRREPAGRHGHRQKTLYKHGNATLALFCFDAGSGLQKHVAPGTVVIHCITGEISVTTSHGENLLPTGTLLALAPGEPHDLLARTQATVLVTVCM